MADIFVAHQDTKKRELSTSEELSPIPKTKHRPQLLSSFCINPTGVRFENQAEHEKVLLFLRKHFLTNLSWIISAIFLAAIPVLAQPLITFVNIDLSFIPTGLTTILTFFYYAALFSYSLVHFTEWFYNIFIVTEDRVVDIDYSNIVIHNVAETKMTHIQDVNYTQVGFIGSLFNYGDVFVQTAGNEVNFESIAAPNPRKATEIIASLIGGNK